jgi:uroporphyrinogen-III synthase
LKILITRPEPGASATAARLTALGHTSLIAPCLAIKPIALNLPHAPTAIILTSGQAIPALPASYRNIPVFCVGDATAGRLREAGFGSVTSANGDADDLFTLILASRLPGTYLLAVGERHGLALAKKLRASGITLVRRTVYSASPLRILPPAAAAALAAGEINVALFYSAETARNFIRLKPPNTADIAALALSRSVAVVLNGLPWRQIHVALAPTEADLLALLT